MGSRTASIETIEKAKKFMTCMNTLLNFVEDMTQFIPEGRYLEMMNLTKDIYGFKPDDPITIQAYLNQVVNTISNDPIVLEQARVVNYKPKKYNEAKSDMEKLKSGEYSICVKCDKVISKGYMRQHIHNGSCVRVDETKKLTKDTTKLSTTNYKKCITLIRSWIHKADLRKIKMYRVALDYYKDDPDMVNEIETKLHKIAIIVQ